MPGWKKILCPIDFSESSRRAMLDALALARRHEAQVHLLHVLEEPWVSMRGELLAPPEIHRSAVEGATRELAAWRQVAEGIAPGRVVTELLRGHPAETAVRVAREGGFDLVVIGTHGRRGLRRLLMGSIAEEVARAAPCPVLLVRPGPSAFDVAPD